MPRYKALVSQARISKLVKHVNSISDNDLTGSRDIDELRTIYKHLLKISQARISMAQHRRMQVRLEALDTYAAYFDAMSLYNPLVDRLGIDDSEEEEEDDFKPKKAKAKAKSKAKKPKKSKAKVVEEEEEESEESEEEESEE